MEEKRYRDIYPVCKQFGRCTKVNAVSKGFKLLTFVIVLQTTAYVVFHLTSNRSSNINAIGREKDLFDYHKIQKYETENRQGPRNREDAPHDFLSKLHLKYNQTRIISGTKPQWRQSEKYNFNSKLFTPTGSINQNSINIKNDMFQIRATGGDLFSNDTKPEETNDNGVHSNNVTVGTHLPKNVSSPLTDTHLSQSNAAVVNDTSLQQVTFREGGEARRQMYISHLLSGDNPALLSRDCKPRRSSLDLPSMVFVKVHKSASSTVANILARYALRYSLNVALPRKMPTITRFNYFSPTITPKDVFPNPPGQDYHLMFNHMTFNRRDLEVIMPNKTFYFAIMRNPEDRFVSGFFYYGLGRLFTKKFRVRSPAHALKLLLQRPHAMKKKMPEYYNSLASDTGLPVDDQADADKVRRHIDTLERDLDLMLVVEYFDESMVMLKRKACLSLRDIVYMKINARDKSTRVALTSDERHLFRKFQMADFEIYQHFYEKFWRLVHAEGEDFFLEVSHFKQIQRDVTDFCTMAASPWDFFVVPSSDWNERFSVTKRDCSLMRMTELALQIHLIERAARLFYLDFPTSSRNKLKQNVEAFYGP